MTVLNLIFASTSPEPTVEPTAETFDVDPDQVAEWFEGVEARASGLLAAGVVALVVWLIGHFLIKAFAASIERGAQIADPKTLAALRKARIRVPETDETEARLEAERRRQRAHTIKRVLDSALAILIVILLLMTVLNVLGVPVGPMLASAGILGVALGFGAQSLVKDVLAGVFMLIEDQYGVGDVVDLGEASGSVEEVGLRCTRLRALDGTVWYIPNGEITRVGNMTRLWSRVMIEVRFAYDTDVEAAKGAMIDAVTAAAQESESVASALLGDAEVAGIESLEYNAVMLRLMCQVNPAMQWDVQREVRREMRRIFAERGIRLAVPGDAMVVDSHARDTDEPHRPGLAASPRRRTAQGRRWQAPSSRLGRP
ncbi:mechanosensitive ion channel family protein [Demequina litorisediminis]|uniref:mechanosensitive ion channel family protein n=1 Tax=Demequina litorisediminis TaxID=1849022 RepID=UPI0024E12842|nr:mechanosensitive ion channel family protein [Demequina litorisediminis]